MKSLMTRWMGGMLYRCTPALNLKSSYHSAWSALGILFHDSALYKCSLNNNNNNNNAQATANSTSTRGAKKMAASFRLKSTTAPLLV